MLRDPSAAALADCGKAALKATNGHGRRWAVARCVRTLVANGTPAGIAERSALAMVAVAQSIADVQRRSQDAAPGIQIRQSINLQTGVSRADMARCCAALREPTLGAVHEAMARNRL